MGDGLLTIYRHKIVAKLRPTPTMVMPILLLRGKKCAIDLFGTGTLASGAAFKVASDKAALGGGWNSGTYEPGCN